MEFKIPLFKIYWDEQDVEIVSRMIRSGANWAVGEKVKEFENQIARYNDTSYAVAVNSGTSALHILMMSYGISKDDEVIVPSFTFIATANAPLFVNAKPIFADIEETTFGLDPDSVKKKITKKTKAIIPIHFAGIPCQIERLREIADESHIPLIEDAAESMGASINGKKVGTFGNASILSFCQNKVITTGEGGAILTNSAEIYEKAKLIRSHGRLENASYFSSTEYLDYVTLGYNFRMSNIVAALGTTQIEKIDNIINWRREKANFLTQNLSRIKQISIPEVAKNSFGVYQMYPILIKEGKSTRNELQRVLAAKGILTRVYFDPVHLTSFYQKTFGCARGDLPTTERVSDMILSLPIFPTLNTAEMEYIVDQIGDFFSRRTNRSQEI
jgi:perosamine synthetase